MSIPNTEYIFCHPRKFFETVKYEKWPSKDTEISFSDRDRHISFSLTCVEYHKILHNEITPFTVNDHRSFNISSWWRHQMETFSAISVGNSPVTGEFAGQRPVTRSFDVFFDLRLNKRLS